MKLNLRFLYILFLNITYISVMVWIGYKIWTGKFPFFTILLLFAMFMRLPGMLTAYRRYSTEDDSFTLDLSLKPAIQQGVTPEFIADILGNPKVIQVIKNDLLKAGKIGYREEWRLGLITADHDTLKNISPMRTAVLHSTDYFKSNNIAITNGILSPWGLPKWDYGLSTKLNRGEFINIRSIQVEEPSKVEKYKCLGLPGFLREQGFPIKESYLDGDPLTTERGGTIVVDNDKVVVIYPRYFVQRRLIDDDGNLLDLGIDENFSHNLLFEVKMKPSVSKILIRRVSAKGYTPIVRYHSLPYASDFMLPILDTPMSDSGWADLFIDTRGKAKLFIAKQKNLEEWYEMMERLRQLFSGELAKKDYHLLGLTKDQTHLNEYFSQKQKILEDFFIVIDWSLI